MCLFVCGDYCIVYICVLGWIGYVLGWFVLGEDFVRVIFDYVV